MPAGFSFTLEISTPDFRRTFQPGGAYFFTVVSDRRAPILCSQAARGILRDAFVACRRRWPFRIDAIVLLPDHVHTIWTLPVGDARLWDEIDFERHFDYVHYNPVKHGLSPCPRDWPHSSFHRWAGRGVYPADWGCSASGPGGALNFDDLKHSGIE